MRSAYHALCYAVLHAYTAIVCLSLCFCIVFSVTLYEKLNELGEKKQSLIDEMEKENRGTPAEERERLLKQVTPVTDILFPVYYMASSVSGR